MKLNDILNEANRGKVFKAAKKGSYPATIVVVQNGKVIHQEPVSTADVAPATFNVMQKKYPNALIHLEDNTGKRLFSESELTEKKSSPYGEIMQKLDKGLKQAIKSGGVPQRYAKDYVKSLERIAKKNSKNFFKDYGKFTADDFEEDVIYNMQNEEYSVKTEDHDCFAEWLVEKQSQITEAEYQGRTVKLNKPMQGDVSKFKVYVNGPKGKVVKVNFGAKGSENRIKKSDPARRKSFRARHNCDNPGPKHKARYWSCRKW